MMVPLPFPPPPSRPSPAAATAASPLQVGLIQTNLKPDERRKAYGSDITYVTNSELGFDYLRDNICGVSTTPHLLAMTSCCLLLADDGQLCGS
jgi:hypothetical protein